MSEEITNKVAESGLITIDPADFYTPGERVVIDIKPLLFEELMLREKDFREYVKNHDWSGYIDKFVAITCSNDAIIPVWAYMLLAASLAPFAAKVVFGDLNELESVLFNEKLNGLDASSFEGKRVVIKGCGDIPVPVSAYVAITGKLEPFVKSIMYGEPCSTVPVFKKR